MNMKPPEDFVKAIGVSQRKDTADSNLARNANLDFIDDSYHSPPKMSEYAIKNYPIPSSGLSSHTGSLKEIPEVRIRETTGGMKQGQFFFNENLTLAEIDRLEKQQNREYAQLSPVYYLNSPPPGITPPRYPQKSPTYTPDIQMQQPIDYGKQVNLNIPNNGTPQMNYLYVNSPDRQQQQQMMYQQMSPSQSNFSNNNLYLKRTGNNKNITLSTSPEIPTQQQQQGGEQLQLFRQGSIPEKKKPIILEESMQRYTGRLKFFDENKNYGFIIMDEDGSDIFVHYDDLSKAGISKELLKTARLGNMIKLAFSCMKYVGKYDKSRKATDIQVLQANTEF